MLDIKKIPFSRSETFLTISPLFKKEQNNELFLRSVRGGDFNKNLGYLFKIELIDSNGNVLDYKVQMEFNKIILKNKLGHIEFSISKEDYFIFQGKGVGLKLTRRANSYDNAIKLKENYYRINCTNNDLRIITHSVNGSMSLEAPWQGDRSKYISVIFMPDDRKKVAGVIDEFKTSVEIKEYNKTFNEVADNSLKDFNYWKENSLNGCKDFIEGFYLANYITWSSVVPNEGQLQRNAMYMSKNWMLNIWSWDNCFNALALIETNPKMALEQMLIFFDHQVESGVLPDFINDKFAYYSFTKPPIEGWFLNIFLERNKSYLKEVDLETLYSKLIKWTNYWFDYTDYNNNGLPSYNHGNDAGWDNSTLFIEGTPLQSPDLLSFLVIQMDTLSELAILLGKENESNFWRKRANDNLNKLIKYFWTGSEFKAIKKNEPNNKIPGDSLINYIPIILGKRLPKEIREKLYDGLIEENRFLTEYGLATESLTSDFYEDDGYWRGPIWAPSTALIVDGLIRSGYKEFGLEIAERYLKMANKNGMAENFNAKTGEGLRDKSFTWTSSVFLFFNNLLFNERMN